MSITLKPGDTVVSSIDLKPWERCPECDMPLTKEYIRVVFGREALPPHANRRQVTIYMHKSCAAVAYPLA